MRYYRSIRYEIENLVYPHVHLMLQDPFVRFGIDIVYFFSCEHGTGWKPYNIYNHRYPMVVWKDVYTPHLLSPLNNDTRLAMKLTMSHVEPMYPEFYASVVRRCGENKLLQFVAHMLDVMNKHFEEERDVSLLFFAIQHIARMGVFFQQMGTADAPHMAAALISVLMFREFKMLNYGTKSVFDLLHEYCQTIVESYEATKKNSEEQLVTADPVQEFTRKRNPTARRVPSSKIHRLCVRGAKVSTSAENSAILLESNDGGFIP